MKRIWGVLASLLMLAGCTYKDITSSAELNGNKEPLHLNIAPQRLFVIQAYREDEPAAHQKWVDAYRAEFSKCGIAVAFGDVARPKMDSLSLSDPIDTLMPQLQAFQPDYILEILQIGTFADSDTIRPTDFELRLSDVARNQVVWKATGWMGKIVFRSVKPLPPTYLIGRLKRDGILMSCPVPVDSD